MKKTQLQLKTIKLVGINKVRTSNIVELNPETAQIASCFQKFLQQDFASRIPNRVNPNVIFSVYTEYESDHTGEYSYFLGEESSDIAVIPKGLDSLIIPEQKYIKFTTEAGSMPDIVINSWQKIWQMSSESLGGTRSYRADFEIYDERSIDYKNAIVDIYIGIN
ncbi:GyrI-like domain-containing protein [Candidatus Tisiphia endosymbiont of Micropterix aruncella]|uniref:GyrI-like domain-containing protein n=1 Tax=Candidatus Tisiphia endosymbiont of Micropterix aruncella TaxID=3066271 RepID=UPI003AA9A640